METRRLQYLLELSRLGSMREVADVLGTTTSTVSQQIAALARETGATLVEPDGRRVRLTPAGQRLAAHAVTVLAAVEAARADLDPHAEPAGTVRVAGFETAIRRSLLPVVDRLAVTHPDVRVVIHELEPDEAFARLATDDLDLALTYDYNLAPCSFDRTLDPAPLWTVPWDLGVPAAEPDPGGSAAEVFRRVREREWIINSRGTADRDVVLTIAAEAGFEPVITHQADSLALLQHLVIRGLGIGLLPRGEVLPGVRLLRLRDPDVVFRSYAVVRRGRAAWPPLALVRHHLMAHSSSRDDDP